MPFRSMEQGIAAIQVGNLTEGARLLRIALKSEVLTGNLRAIACLWLAETSGEPDFKRTCYQDALTADPNNQDARQRLAALLATNLPPTTPAYTPTVMPPVAMTPVAPAAPVPGQSTYQTAPAGTYRIVGVIGGPNGPGTALFVTRDGLLATTRYVVGGLEHVTIELETHRQLLGRVVRAFPEFDLAFIRVEQPVNDLLSRTLLPKIPDSAPLTVISYTGKRMSGKQRPTKRILSPQWFPTDLIQLPDAGGNPVFDEREYLLGMLTKNCSRASAYLFGLHINSINKCVEQYVQEVQATRNAPYCASCGSLTKAAGAGGYYCEYCGSTMPQAQHIARMPQPQTAGYYYESGRISCTNCNATVGFYNGVCLRCGQAPTTQIK